MIAKKVFCISTDFDTSNPLVNSVIKIKKEKHQQILLNNKYEINQ